MLGALANRRPKDVERDLADDEEEDTQGDVSQRPSVLEGIDDQNDLQDDVDEETAAAEKVEHDEEADGLGWSQPPALEGQQRDGEREGEHDHRRSSQQPHRRLRAILVQLEPDETVDQQTHAQGRGQAALDGGDVGIDGRAGGSDTGVENERADGQDHVDVEEHDDLLPAYIASPRSQPMRPPIEHGNIYRRPRTDRGILGPHVKNHNGRHDQGQNVHRIRGPLKDDGVGQLDATRIAIGLDAGRARNGRRRSHQGAEWNRRLSTYRLKVAKSHRRCGTKLGDDDGDLDDALEKSGV